MDDNDLRARLDAQIAARRVAGAQPRRRGKSAAPGSTALPAPDCPESGASVRRASRWWLLVRFAGFAVVIAALALGVRAFVLEPFFVPSASMEPTLHGCPGCNDDRVLVNKLSYRLHSVHRGDVVVFTRPPSLQLDDADLIKRVIGLPGETVSAHGGSVYIGDRRLSEPYVSSGCGGTADFAPVTVPARDAFMMGDNRCDSTDSRVFGPIAESTIVGRAFVIVWPLGRIHWL